MTFSPTKAQAALAAIHRPGINLDTVMRVFIFCLCQPFSRSSEVRNDDGAIRSAARRTRLAGQDQRHSAALLPRAGQVRRRADRSEEHTSELQSLMRSSYAVLCLKKKNK